MTFLEHVNSDFQFKFFPCFAIQQECKIFLCCLTFKHHLLSSFVDNSIGHLLLFSCQVMFNCLQPHELQQARPPCLSLSSRDCSNSCSLSQWCHPPISSSVTLFFLCSQSFRASGSFPTSLIRWPKYWSFWFSISPPNELLFIHIQNSKSIIIYSNNTIWKMLTETTWLCSSSYLLWKFIFFI